MTPEQLKAQRKNLGLTQEEMAKRLGVSGRTYQRYESRAVPKPAAILATAVAGAMSRTSASQRVAAA